MKIKQLSIAPDIAPDAKVIDCDLGIYNEIAAGVQIVESSLGNYSYIMERCDIIHTSIGKFSNIASEVRINPGNHPMEWVSQHHFLYRCRLYGLRDEDNDSFFQWRKLQRVEIGHDCWIGHKAIIMPGVTIGNGAVVAAGAVVTKDVAPYTISAGVPAKQVGKRFPEKIWEALEEIAWWDWDYDTLKARVDDFYDIRKFIMLYGNKE
jgi:phosphonate metabolism protein (transferase hexapeptide repeat family)